MRVSEMSTYELLEVVAFQDTRFETADLCEAAEELAKRIDYGKEFRESQKAAAEDAEAQRAKSEHGIAGGTALAQVYGGQAEEARCRAKLETE
jgi:hypothetical protein